MVWVQFELLCKCDPHTFCYLQARPSRDNRAGWQLHRSEASRERGCCAIWWLFIFGCELVWFGLKSVEEGKSVSVRVDRVGRRIMKKTMTHIKIKLVPLR